MIQSYASIYALGHRALAELFLDPVTIEEKIDGSQISFGRYPVMIDGPEVESIIRIRSKGAEITVFAPEKMFAQAVETITAIGPMLQLGWTYRGEYLAKPHHNTLNYDRVPTANIMVFDIDRGAEDYLRYEAKQWECALIGLECVPLIWHGDTPTQEQFREMLKTTSVLGGQTIEGVVVKNYARYGKDKHILLGKFVSETFKEVHLKTWRAENPGPGDIVDRLIQQYHSQARWQKAVQHLREDGRIDDSPRDIQLLFKEIPADIKRECAEDIKEALFAWAWPKIQRGVMHGLPEWYKDSLLIKQFELEPFKGAAVGVETVDVPQA